MATVIQQLEAALQKADAAGDSFAARHLAQEIAKLLKPAVTRESLKSANPAEYDPASPEFRAKYGPATDRWAALGMGMTDAFQGVGQALGFVSTDDVKATRERDKPLRDAHPVVAGLGTALPMVPAALIPGANTMAGAAIAGGLSGALMPYESLDEMRGNTATGAAFGPLGILAGRGLSSAWRAGKAVVEPLTKGGQERIAGRTLEAFAGGPDKARAAAETIRNATTDVLPGVRPTTAEVANNAGLAQLERTVANNPETLTRLTDIKQGNRNALLKALDDVAGSDADLAAAKAARDETAEQLYGSARRQGADAAAVARANQEALRAQAEALRKAAANPLPEVTAGYTPTRIDGGVAALQSAADDLSGLAGLVDERGFIGTVNVRDLLKRPDIRESIASASRMAAAFGEEVNTANPVTVLHWAKKALDGKLNEAVRSGNRTLVAALESQKKALLSRIESISPGYKQAAEKFGEMSVPINRMEIGRAMREKLVPALGDYGANVRLRPESFARALRDADATAAEVTGFSGAKMGDIMAPEQIKTLQQVAEQLARRVNADELGRAAGSNTGQNLVSQNLLRQLAGPLGLPQSMVERVAGSTLAQTLLRPVQFTGKLGEARVAEILADAAVDPQVAARLLEAGVPPEMIGLLRYQGLLAPSAASAAANRPE